MIDAELPIPEPGPAAEVSPWTGDVGRFCRAELERTYISDADLRDLAVRSSALFLAETASAIPVILDRVGEALRKGEGLALIRIGDGEGAALGMTRPNLNPAIIDGFRSYFDAQNNCPVPTPACVAFCNELSASYPHADILGVRAFQSDEIPLIGDAIDKGLFHHALGLIYPRELLVGLLKSGAIKDRLLTSAWIHLDLIPHIDTMLSLANKVVVVSGRPQLARPFWKRLKGRDFEFIEVPPEGGDPCALEASHIHSRFPEVKRALRRDLRGTLVLVGAGMFGKIYCAEAKANGAVALDMGSAFDLLSGLITRPVFADFEFDMPPWV